MYVDNVDGGSNNNGGVDWGAFSASSSATEGTSDTHGFVAGGCDVGSSTASRISDLLESILDRPVTDLISEAINGISHLDAAAAREPGSARNAVGSPGQPARPLDNVLQMLQNTPLGRHLTFPSFVGEGRLGDASLIGQPTTVDNATGVLAAATGLTDVLATVLTGSDPALTPQLSAIFLNAISGCATNEEALASVRSLADALGVTPQKMQDALVGLMQSGKITKEEFGKHMMYLEMLVGQPAGQGDAQATGQAGGASSSSGHAEKGEPMDGPGGFVYKPVSESDGNLVILLPEDMTGEAQSVTLRDANGKVLETGDAKGAANGNREHFRFDKPGGDYPGPLTVEVKLDDGSIKTVEIAAPGKRYD